MKIILASQSPRRKDLMEQMGLSFEVVPSNFEEILDDTVSPREKAIELALGKARTVAHDYPDALVVASDSIVSIDEKQLDKPKDNAEAKDMIQRLSGRMNLVTCSLAVMCKDRGIEITDAASVEVYFKPYDKKAVDAYVATGDSLDKAGSYGIQTSGAQLVEYIVGDYDVTIGLPTKLLAKYLNKLGITCHAVELMYSVERRPQNDT